MMDAIIERCAGLDVHQATVVACVLIGQADCKQHEIRTFSTMTQDLEAMRDWLKGHGVTHVGMECIFRLNPPSDFGGKRPPLFRSKPPCRFGDFAHTWE
jgi:hypothetical protein